MFKDLKNWKPTWHSNKIVIDDTVNITGIAQLAAFIRACDYEFNIYEELIYDTTSRQDIFEKVE